MTLDSLLKQAVAREASDIHLAPGNPAMIRVNTRLTPLNDTVLSAADTENMALRILGNDGFTELQEVGEIDTSYRMPGLANFRV
ncbi:MAG TPA: type IV pili twitching motility protein PilT, partial [Syntrophomonadaceae bacterium]|nr:type IV pili twitching motility protein PilT [Syntrophomonadaceae bacterium]